MWEMLQMPFFKGMYFSDFKVWLTCARASLGDVVIILFIFALGRLIFRGWSWIDHLNVFKIIYLVIMGSSIAILIEIISIKYDRWVYSEIMPLIPKIHVGIIPVIQMIIAPFFSYILVFIIIPVRKVRFFNNHESC
jgi:hypothetical protein